MAGRHPFAALHDRMLPEARAEAEALARKLDKELDLAGARAVKKVQRRGSAVKPSRHNPGC